MEAEQIREFFEKIKPLSKNEWAAFASALEPVSFKKNELILNFDQVERYIYFINKGIVRKYLYSSGEEFDIGFFFPGKFFSDYNSILTGVPSGFCTQAITNVEAVRILKKDLFSLYESSPAFNTIGRTVTELFFLEVVNLWADSVSLTGEERYLKLKQTNPEYLQKIPIKYLSRYLGLHPNSLSRIRKKFK